MYPAPGIITKEIVPHAPREPSYLARESLEIVASEREDAPAVRRPAQVNLRERLRVVIFYDTVHVNSEGIVHFVGDIYGHDRVLDQALARGYPYPEKR